MATVDIISELFGQVDDQIAYVAKRSQASLYPSEVVAFALLHALTGKGNRAFWRWLNRGDGSLFPKVHCRTRLFHLFNSHCHLIGEFLAPSSLIGVIDSYGTELLHPAEKDEARCSSARKASPTVAGSSAASAAYFSTTGAG